MQVVMSLIAVDYSVCELRSCTHVLAEYVPNVSRYRHRICLTFVGIIPDITCDVGRYCSNILFVPDLYCM